MDYPLQYSWASLVTQLVKNPPAMHDPGFGYWVGKIPWKREQLTHSSIFAWRISRIMYNPWGCKESDMTERLSLSNNDNKNKSGDMEERGNFIFAEGRFDSETLGFKVGMFTSEQGCLQEALAAGGFCRELTEGLSRRQRRLSLLVPLLPCAQAHISLPRPALVP